MIELAVIGPSGQLELEIVAGMLIDCCLTCIVCLVDFLIRMNIDWINVMLVLAALWSRINYQELVSLSTDNELKLWNINTGQCLKTYIGHKNEKIFVGLSVNSNHMVCGSENNHLYVYCKHVSKHVTSYALNTPPDQSSS